MHYRFYFVQIAAFRTLNGYDQSLLRQHHRQLSPALRKAPRSREMLRMQFEVVSRTRRYCTVPGGLWLQSWLLWHFPQTYSRLRELKG